MYDTRCAEPIGRMRAGGKSIPYEIIITKRGGGHAKKLETFGGCGRVCSHRTSRLWEEGTSSSIFLPVKMSVAVKWHLAWPCFPVLEVVTSITWRRAGVNVRRGAREDISSVHGVNKFPCCVRTGPSPLARCCPPPK